MSFTPTLRQRARRLRRLVLSGGWTALCYLVWAPVALLLLPFPGASRRWGGTGTRWWSAGLLRILGVRTSWRGRRPDPPYLLASNHLGYVDILVLGAILGPTFVSKHDIALWPVLGHLARAAGTIFVDRGRRRDTLRVMDEMDRAWGLGAGIVLFPEGTSSRGDRVQPLKPALLEWAVRHDRPVHVVALRYRSIDPTHPAEDAVCWWGELSFRTHAARFLTVRSVEATVVFADPAAGAPDRGALADRLHVLLTTSYGDAGR